MKLIRLTLEGFGKFRNETFEFNDGINVIYGLNEAGKSTIHAAIEGVLYGFLDPSKKRKTYFEAHERYTPPKGVPYRASLVLEVSDKVLLIERDFNKKNHTVSVYNEKTGEDITKDILLDSSTNLPDIASLIDMPYFLYKNTLSIKQLEAKTEKAASDDLLRRLQNLKQTRTESFSSIQAIKMLEDKQKEIGTERAQTKPLAIELKRLEALKEEMTHTRRVHTQMLEEKANLEEKITALDACETALAKASDALRQIENTKKRLILNAIETELKALKENLKAANITLEDPLSFFQEEKATRRTLRDAIERLERIDVQDDTLSSQVLSDEECLSTRAYQALKKKREDVKTFQKQIDYSLERELKKNIDTHTQEIKTLKEREESLTAKKKQAKIFMFTVLLLPIGLFKWLSAKNQLKMTAETMHAKESALKEEERKYNRQQKSHALAEKEIKSIYASESVEDFDAFESKLFIARQKNQNHIQRENILAKLEGLKEEKQSVLAQFASWEERLKTRLGLSHLKAMHRAEETVEKIKRLLDHRSLSVFKESVDMNQALYDVGEEDKVLNEVKRLKDTRLTLKEAIHRLNVKIESELARMRAIETIEYEQNKCKEKIMQYEHRLKVYALAQKRIEKAVQKMEEDFAPVLSKNIEGYIKSFTRASYQTIKVRKDLTFAVLNPETKRLEKPLYFSTGTLDQLYFSMRLGILKTLKKSAMPLFLDDAFVNYDSARLNATLKSIAAIKDRVQILLFTCHQRERDVLDQLNVKYTHKTLN